MKTPRTKAEWQEAVDAAAGALTIDAARQYGLITGGPKFNIARCEGLLRGGRKKGIKPSSGAVANLTAKIDGYGMRT